MGHHSKHATRRTLLDFDDFKTTRYVRTMLLYKCTVSLHFMKNCIFSFSLPYEL